MDTSAPVHHELKFNMHIRNVPDGAMGVYTYYCACGWSILFADADDGKVGVFWDIAGREFRTHLFEPIAKPATVERTVNETT